MEFSLESHEILPHVRVYTGAFPDIDQMLSVLFEHEKTTTENPEAPHLFEPYRPWYTFGRVTDVRKTPVDLSPELIKRQLYFYDRVREVRASAIADYCKIYNVLDNIQTETWVQDSVNLGEYYSDSTVDYLEGQDVGQKPKAMNYHTDFETKFMCEDSDNFLLTCNMYWNDDYEGGEIVFFNSDELVPYKPKSGEVIVFPSGSPYYPIGGQAFFHCANSVFEGRKYFSRNYLQYKHSPTQEMRDALTEYPRGDKNPGDQHYNSLYNQMILRVKENSNECLVHPIVKRFYGKLKSSSIVEAFDEEYFN